MEKVLPVALLSNSNGPELFGEALDPSWASPLLVQNWPCGQLYASLPPNILCLQGPGDQFNSAQRRHVMGSSSASAQVMSAVPPQEAENQLRKLARGEWWLWVSTLAMTLLSAVAFLLVSFPQLAERTRPWFFVDPSLTMSGLVALILLFNAHLVRRQWQLRGERRRWNLQLSGGTEDDRSIGEFRAVATDPLTGLCRSGFLEQSLAKEMALARRRGQPLTVLKMDVDGFGELKGRYGDTFGDAVLLEFTRRLKKATRGSDLAARLAGAEFLLVLPECGSGDVRHVVERLGPLEVDWRGRKMTVDYSCAWVDYQPGELPVELLKRADHVLHLYKNAGEESVPTIA